MSTSANLLFWIFRRQHLIYLSTLSQRQCWYCQPFYWVSSPLLKRRRASGGTPLDILSTILSISSSVTQGKSRTNPNLGRPLPGLRIRPNHFVALWLYFLNSQCHFSLAAAIESGRSLQ